MIMARQGINNSVAFRLPIVGVVLAVLLVYSSSAWSACETRTSSTGSCYETTAYTYTGCDWPNGGISVSCGGGGSISISDWYGGNRECEITSCTYDGCRRSFTYVSCPSECELKQAVCIEKGFEWIPGENGECGTCNDCDEQCQCEEQGMIWTGSECIEDTTICSEDRQKCQSVGGKFSGTVLTSGGDKCCSSVCDLCGNESSKNVFRLKRQQCCAQNQAPPDPESQCSVPVQSGCGMTTSQWTDPQSNDWECQDPNNSSQTMDRFTEMCSDDYDDENNNDDDNSSNSNDGSSSSQEGDGSSSSQEGDGSSSSQEGDGSSSSQEGDGYSSGEGDGDCPECPYLADILSSLGSIEGTTANILLCLQIPHLCPALDGDIDFSEVVDTLHNINMSIDELKYIVDGIRAFDSLSLRALFKLDSSTLRVAKYDSLILRNDTMTWVKFDALGNVVDTSVHTLNDTTRKWLQRIADSIGVMSDSLAAHIDSIVKYQKYANDNFDSILYGSGKGFSLVDSLIDSAVKYFKASNHYDSVYNRMFADSIGEVIDYLSTMPGDNAREIGYAFGYGDTASSTLRGDLEGIRGAIEGLGDGLGGDIAGALDSAWGNGTAAEGSGFEDYGTDSAGYAGVLDSYYSEGTTVDSAYLVDGDTCTTVDCIVSNVNYNVDSMGEAFKASLDTQYRSLSDSSSVWFDSIKKNLMFVDFDSVLVNPLRQRIPNTNTCPENCFSFDVASGAIPGVNNITFPICKNFTIGGISTNALLIVRLILRIMTAMGCIYIGLWFIAGKKG